MALVKSCELLEHPESMFNHNVISNDKREGAKINMIGQPAAKRPGNRSKVQRLALVGYVTNVICRTSHERRTNCFLTFEGPQGQ